MPAPTKPPVNPAPPKEAGKPRRRPTHAEASVEELATAIDKNIVADIQRMRHELDLSLEDVAKPLGRTRSWLSKLETGERRMFASDLLLLMDTMRALERDHPGVAMLDRYAPAKIAGPAADFADKA